MPPGPDVMIIVQHLARYLRRHPEACDTAEGIARWWVDAGPRAVPVDVVECALDLMSAWGVVESSRAADGRVRYRRAGGAGGLDATLDAIADDPRAVTLPGASGRRMH